MTKRLYGKTKKITVDRLKELFKLDRFDYLKLVLLFGSRVNDLDNIQSDYDFAIIEKDREFKWGVVSQFGNDIEDIFGLFEYDYDIVDLSKAEGNILESIKDSYILLKGDISELPRVFRGE